MIKVQNLVKWYGPTLAVDHVSFDIPEGQIVGFLGPNGAGKSTTLRILTGYLPATSGRALIAGLDVFEQSQQARAKIGYLPESTPLYPEMRVEEFLDFRGKLHQLDRSTRRQRIDMVCERCGLGQVRRRLIGQLSRGNKQRVGLAQALLHDPTVLILDEPTAGLDPNQIQQVRQLIRELRGKHTILLSTHILPEIERIADRALIIANGQIRFDQEVHSQRRIVVEAQASAEALERVARQLPGVRQAQAAANRDGWSRLLVTTEPEQDVREALGRLMLHNQFLVRELGFESASLEDHFRQVTAAGSAEPAGVV